MKVKHQEIIIKQQVILSQGFSVLEWLHLDLDPHVKGYILPEKGLVKQVNLRLGS